MAIGQPGLRAPVPGLLWRQGAGGLAKIGPSLAGIIGTKA
jgi:hypothetical protein